MSPATRCDQIVDMIDQVLGDCGVPAVGASIAAVPANDAGYSQQSPDAAPASGLRTRLQRDVLGPLWRADGSRP